MNDSRRTALGIPCPWSGDESDPITRTYWAWFRLYKSLRIIRHRLGLHDWQDSYPLDVDRVVVRVRRCTWCGQRGAA